MTVDEGKDTGTEKEQSTGQVPSRDVTDLYAKVDKSRKSKSSNAFTPDFHFSMSRDSCPEEDRELNEMWMVSTKLYKQYIKSKGNPVFVHRPYLIMGISINRIVQIPGTIFPFPFSLSLGDRND